MKRKKVMAFFVLLLIFATALTILELVRYGQIDGFINSNGNSGASFGNQSILVFASSIALFILIAAFAFRYLGRYHERVVHHDYHEEEVPFKRKIIGLDFS